MLLFHCVRTELLIVAHARRILAARGHGLVRARARVRVRGRGRVRVRVRVRGRGRGRVKVRVRVSRFKVRVIEFLLTNMHANVSTYL